jgi:hypothetical protein
MRLDGSPRHVQLLGDFGVVAALQKQLNNLLLARSQPNGLVSHPIPLYLHGFPFDTTRG